MQHSKGRANAQKVIIVVVISPAGLVKIELKPPFVHNNLWGVLGQTNISTLMHPSKPWQPEQRPSVQP
jgi:hypothetical protein